MALMRDSEKDAAEDIGDLVDRARAGDRTALGALFTQWQEDLEAYVRKRAAGAVLAKESAADIVQSACREVLADIDRATAVSIGPGLRAWLYKAALHKIVDRHRYWQRDKRHAEREARSLDGPSAWTREALSTLCGALPSPSTAAARDEDLQRIADAIVRLPDHYQKVLRLAYFERLPQREIADRMGRSEDSVRGLVARAVARLARATIGK